MAGLTTIDLKPFQGGDVRLYVQRYIANPNEPYDYYGRMQLDSPKRTRDEPERKRSASDDRLRQWKTIDTVVKDTSTNTTDFETTLDREMSEDLHEMFDEDEEFVMQLTVGKSTHPQNFDQWESKMIMTSLHITEIGPDGTLNPQEGEDNDVVKLTGTMYYDDAILVKKVRFTETGSAESVRAVLDSKVRWVDSRNRYRWYALLTNAAAVSPSSILIGSGRKTVTWQAVEPTGLSTDGLLDSIQIIGDFLVGFRSTTAESHYWIALDEIDAGTNNFTVVTTGYTAAKGPVRSYVRSAGQTLICGLGGYIYELASAKAQPSIKDAGVATTQNLNDIHGLGSNVVAVGASNALIISTDGGANWSALTGPSSGNALTAVWMLSDEEWFVGTDNGELWFTEDIGVTYTQISIETGVDAINQIRFSNRYVGAMATTASAASVKGRTYRTSDSGANWDRTAPHVLTPVVADEINTIALADTNTMLTGGLETGTDGIVALGT